MLQLATRSPRSQRWAEPSFTPVPVVRVFNHREMVQATRDKVTVASIVYLYHISI